ncbi:hypothetical protein BT96DRAFT_791989, partial [Gymnopus androsaceus JB14]
RITEAETEVQCIDDEISKLKLQKEAKLVEIVSLQDILSPIRRVPLEILSEIFESACVQDDEDGVFLSVRRAMRCALVITAVCSAWRKVALATPRIWSM